LTYTACEHTDDVGLIGLDLELLNSINQKLSLLDLMRKDIGEMKSDLESTQNQITLLRMDNRTMKGVSSMLEIFRILTLSYLYFPQL